MFKKITRQIDTVVIHYLATHLAWSDQFKSDWRRMVVEVRRWHKARGWRDIGYHYVVAPDGSILVGRDINQIGAGVRGHNTGAVHIAYSGGIDARGIQGIDTRTEEQREALYKFVDDLEEELGRKLRVVGHNDLAETLCPGFNVRLDRNAWLLEKKRF